MARKTIAHYEVLDELGAGGMGVVYEAWDTRLERKAAMLVPRSRRAAGQTARLADSRWYARKTRSLT